MRRRRTEGEMLNVLNVSTVSNVLDVSNVLNDVLPFGYPVSHDSCRRAGSVSAGAGSCIWELQEQFPRARQNLCRRTLHTKNQSKTLTPFKTFRTLKTQRF